MVLVVKQMKQLNLFEMDEFTEEQPFETIQQLKSTDERIKQPNQNMALQVGNRVKIILIDEEVDSETHHYRKYYEPHLIGKVGEISKVLMSSKGKITYEVDIYGEKSLFEPCELQCLE